MKVNTFIDSWIFYCNSNLIFVCLSSELKSQITYIIKFVFEQVPFTLANRTALLRDRKRCTACGECCPQCVRFGGRGVVGVHPSWSWPRDGGRAGEGGVDWYPWLGAGGAGAGGQEEGRCREYSCPRPG